MCSDRRKNHGCGQKKPGGTSSAIFGVGTAAKCWELKRCADQVRSRTDNKDEVLEGKFRSLNFSPSTKKTTECSFELFLSIYRYLIFFFSSLKLQPCRTIVLLHCLPQNTPRFPAKKRWHSPPGRVSLGLPSPSPQRLYGRTYVRTGVR